MPNVVIGLLSIALGLWGVSVWWYSLAELLRGLVPLLLLLFGMVALMAGVTRVRDEPDDVSDSDLAEPFDQSSEEKPGE
jgi:hypothetical protein